ncbi:MAG: hypothetical protein WHS88_00960 [Anaerohalosphaeraceae bacterium]
MRNKSKIFLFLAVFTWVSLPAQSRISFSESELTEICQDYYIVSSCPDATQKAIYILAASSATGASDQSELTDLYLYKIGKTGTLLQKIRLVPEQNNSIDYRLSKGPMLAFPQGPLLALNDPGKTRLETLRYPLIKQKDKDPNLLVLATLEKPYVLDAFRHKSKVLRINDTSCFLLAYNKETNQEFFLEFERYGSLLKEIFLENNLDIWDYEKIREDQIIYIGGKVKTIDSRRQQWEYQTGVFDVDKGCQVFSDLFHSEFYEVDTSVSPKSFFPKIIKWADDSFWCIYTSPAKEDSVVFRARCYDGQFSYVGEKELFEIQCGSPNKLPPLNLLDAALLGKNHLVILVYTKGRLAFWVLDKNGRLEMSKSPWKSPKLFSLYGFVPIENSVVAFGREWDSLKDSLIKRKIYCLNLQEQE